MHCQEQAEANAKAVAQQRQKFLEWEMAFAEAMKQATKTAGWGRPGSRVSVSLWKLPTAPCQAQAQLQSAREDPSHLWVCSFLSCIVFLCLPSRIKRRLWQLPAGASKAASQMSTQLRGLNLQSAMGPEELPNGQSHFFRCFFGFSCWD